MVSKWGSYRFSQHVGKQYTYAKGLEELSEVEQLKLENKRKDIELDILKVITFNNLIVIIKLLFGQFQKSLLT